MVETLKKNKTGILIMIASSLCAGFGQMFWKLSSTQEDATKGLVVLMIGFMLYGLGALLMLIAYRYGEVSVLQPVMGFNYILSILIGYYVFGETITFLKVVGILSITAGIIVLGGSSNQ